MWSRSDATVWAAPLCGVLLILMCVVIPLRVDHAHGIHLLIGGAPTRQEEQGCGDERTVIAVIEPNGDVEVNMERLTAEAALNRIRQKMEVRDVRMLYVAAERGATMQQFASFVQDANARVSGLHLVWITEQLAKQTHMACIQVNWQLIR
jgi:hypothetical protein